MLNVLTRGYIKWKPSNLLHNGLQFCLNIKYAYQRITKGYCDRDLWDLDRFYLWIFQSTLKEFPKHINGAPQDFYDEKNDSIEKWISYISKMQHCFENAEADNPNADEQNEFTVDLKRYRKERIKRELELDKWRAAELHKGLQMLEKVFYNLWD